MFAILEMILIYAMIMYMLTIGLHVVCVRIMAIIHGKTYTVSINDFGVASVIILLSAFHFKFFGVY